MKKNKILSSIILVTFLISIIAVSPVNAATVGLVAEWKLDEGIGSWAFDSTTNDNDGMLSGGKFGNALYFDGDNDYVEIPDSTSLDNIEDLTVELWLKPSVKYEANPLFYVFVSKFTPSTSFQFVYHTGGYLYLYVTNGIAVSSIPLTLDAGTWYHLAATFKNADNEGQIFVNGVDKTQSTTTKTMTANNLPLCIGVRADTIATEPYHEVKGVIDEVRISDVVRYTTGFSVPISAFESDSDTVGLWHFDESADSTAFDDSGNGNLGTIVGATWAGPTWVSDGWGTGLHFDGVDDNVRIEDDASLDLSEGITIEATVYPERVSGYQTIVSKRHGRANYALRLWGSRVNFYCTDSIGGWDEWYTGNIVFANDWYTIVATYDFAHEDSMKIMVNGIERVLTLNHVYDSGVIENDYPVYIGIIGGGSQQFKGIIDEVKLWNYALDGLTLAFDDVDSVAVTPIGSSADLRVCLKDWMGNEVSGVALNIVSDEGLTLDLPSPTITGTDGCVEFTASSVKAGVYTITATVSPVDGLDLTDAWTIAIYDPSAGFVTGGGWIYSPEGAYAEEPTLTGKATFGFVSKYKKGADTPTGNTEFVFHAADLKFKSTSYQWLVITGGGKAMFKGEGEVNGVGGYGFMLSATDGGKDGADTFRIKIWDSSNEEVTVYDNKIDDGAGETELGGGSIIVHRK